RTPMRDICRPTGWCIPANNGAVFPTNDSARNISGRSGAVSVSLRLLVLMHSILESFARFFFSLGGVGLLLLGILDSSFLFMPLGNDLLVIALTAAHGQRILYYVAMATVGSVVGVAITHWVSAKGGQKGIEGDRKSRQVAYIERKVQQHGAIAIAIAALMPPPF